MLETVCTFSKQEMNTNKCPDGFFHVNTEANCRKAATIRHGARFAAVGTWNSNHNTKCFTEANGKAIYWNKGGSSTSNHGGPLCASFGCGMGGCDTASETSSPTTNPTAYPTTNPTPNPTAYPTSSPTPNPTAYPTTYPTSSPTPNPTPYPTSNPTDYPTPYPTTYPTSAPTGILQHATCAHTTCSYSSGRTHVYTFGNTYGPAEKWHCEKSGSGCKCVCHSSLQCALRHHHTSGYKKTFEHC
jgi:hypothetical protein